jgi:protoporphyrinogen oxidase
VSRAVVLGAGIAGLVAARQLERLGHHVTVLEANDSIAGLAATTKDADGFSFDLGAHFVTNRLAAAAGIGSEVRTVRYYGESVWLDGRYYTYPTGLLRSPAMVASAVAARLRRGTTGTAADWFRAVYGRALADRVALPLLEAWSGAPAEELAASVGDKIPSSLAQTVFLRAAAKVTGRAVAIGYCHALPQNAGVYHVYPNDGVATICRAVAAGLDGAVRTSTPVEAITVDGGRVAGVRANGEAIEADLVVSTAPVNRLPSLVDGSDALAPYERFRFRPMVFVNLKLRGTALLRDVVVWVPSGAPFFRLTEATQSMPWLAPEGSTSVLCDIGAEIGDAHWSMSDDDLAELCLEHLTAFVPDIRARYLGVHVARLPIAYPVFLKEYEADRQRLADGTGIDGLLSVGRNGEFDHILMEDVYWRTVRRIQRWDAGQPSRSASSSGARSRA